MSDVNDLVEHRIGCCRFCWGRSFRYQRTRNELERAEAQHAAANEKAVREGKDTTLFDPEGGEGYHAGREPNPDCPNASGMASAARCSRTPPAPRLVPAALQRVRSRRTAWRSSSGRRTRPSSCWGATRHVEGQGRAQRPRRRHDPDELDVHLPQAGAGPR